LVKSDTFQDKPVTWSLNPDNVKKVIDGMWGVVNEGGGTGGRARLPNIDVCGKTGSAQLASNEYLKGAGAANAKHFKDNAWFEGFAPRDNPEIAVVALFEHGEHGQYAAPIVKDVIKAYFDKKVRITMLQQEKATHQQRLAGLSGLGLPPGPPAPTSAPAEPRPEPQD
jgi:penicillin-binding protein 2